MVKSSPPLSLKADTSNLTTKMFNRKEYRKEYYSKNKGIILRQMKDKYEERGKEIRLKRKLEREKETVEQRIERLKYMKNYRNINKDIIKNHSQKDTSKFNQYTFSAKKRNYIFELSFEEFTKLFHGQCAYCGKLDSRGIDRIDNKHGYIKSNCTPCCEICNKMKWKWNQKQFIDQIAKIFEYQVTKPY